MLVPAAGDLLPKLKRSAVQFLFDRYFRWRIADLVAPDYPIMLDYPVTPTPRYGYGREPLKRIRDLFEKSRDNYRRELTSLSEILDFASAIATRANLAPSQPSFHNLYFTGMDPLALISFLVNFRPKLFPEIGCGNSTRFARSTIQAYGLPTRVICCDPKPRADIAGLADELHLQPAETLTPDIFERLTPGDILFIDSSHRVFQNSDVTTLFLEVLPGLPEGVLLHIHDIFLPLDYPAQWQGRYYSEQYLLAAMIIASPQMFEIVMPTVFILSDPELSLAIEPIWNAPGMAAVRRYVEKHISAGFLGTSMWLRVSGQNKRD